MGTRALFVTYGGGHVNITRRLLEACLAAGRPTAHVLALSTAASKLRAAGVDCLTVADLTDPVRDAAALREGARLAQTMHTSGLGVTLAESTAYFGLSMADLRATAGADADLLLAQFGRAVWCPMEIARRAIDRIRPDVVITTNSPRAERAATLVASERGIPTLRIEDLFGRTGIVRPVRERLGYDTARRLVGEVRPTAVSVMNGVARDVFLEHAWEEMVDLSTGQVHVMGQPVLERAVERRANFLEGDCEALRKRIGLPRQKPVLLWATDNLKIDEQIMMMLNDWIVARPDVHLCIKMHPGPPDSVRGFFRRFQRANVALMEDGDIHDLILASTATMAHLSTVAFEVALLGKPLIQIDFGAEQMAMWPYREFKHFYDGTVPYLRRGASAILSDLPTAPAILNKLLADPLPSLLAPELQLPTNSSRRILDLINVLAVGRHLPNPRAQT